MNSTFVTTAPKGLAVKVALAALLAACVALIIGAGNAKASTPGAPITADFNHAGLNVDVTLAQLDELVLDSDDPDPLSIAGTYTDANGNFTLPKATGLDFPPINLVLDDGDDPGPADDVLLNGGISLDRDATGNYNDTTGAMSMDLGIALTLGVTDVSALPIPGLGTGPLTCKFAPINISVSTSKGWPHAGKPFVDKAAIKDGALAGAWRSVPAVTTVAGNPSACNLIRNVLKPVGGLWLAQSDTLLTTMPAATEAKPAAETCAEHGQTGTFPNCVTPPQVCPEGQTGTPPNCQPIVAPVPAANISKIAVTPAKGKIKKGKKATLTIKVTNTGDAAGTATVTIKSSNKKVKAPKSVKVTVPAGKTVSKKITIKATKKAKGKANITVKTGSLSAKSTLTVKK